MALPFAVFLFLTGAAVGFLSGLLGIGGGIVMFPLLLYGPTLFGLEAIPVKGITGLTMMQGFFASLSAVLFYKTQRLVSKTLVLTLGLSLFLSSLTGAYLSKSIPDKPLLFIFGMLAFTAAVMMLIPRSYKQDDATEESVSFNRPVAVLLGTTIGVLIGMVGQGGAFILIPMMLYVLKIPLRVALGSTLGIGLFSATAGLIGKIATNQVPFLLAVPLIAGAIPAARLGSIVSKRTTSKTLRWLLAILILASAVKIWTDIF